ncbi:hypothetical protein [Aquimarina sp. 2201CG5-10]|uniref:hypothetical protein n=1 Tax=Aquimarina callyspongiae TaxID=3098150 RepID=UPI002AB4C21B|nr:hypothetical protein [Aquimarina sp. 2201CG5-10]MDY8135015.1 hypothetical protein [Aquimarina sp. 2201CG5-10]
MKTEYIILKEATLNNNCPECYSTESIKLSFKQRRLTSKLVIKTKGTIIESMNCAKCENQIFPGQWTKDIERVYEYHKKTITPKSSSIRFTGLFYSLIALIILFIGIGYLYLNHPELLGIS